MNIKEKWLNDRKKILLKKDHLLICILTGMLLLVIAWPVPDGGEKEKSKSVLWDGQSTVPDAVSSPVGSKEEEWSGRREEEIVASLEKRLENILSAMEGVGQVKVMVTLASSSERIIEKDGPTSRSNIQEEDSAGGKRSSQEMDVQENTVYLKTEQGGQIPYVVKEVSPVIEGVSVVAQGGGNPLIQKNITEVIQALFGIEVHKIKVVKMKQQE